MSGYKNSIFEELYSCYLAATTTTPTAAAVSLTAGQPAILIPGLYFHKLGDDASSLRLAVRGQMTATVTIPTFTVGVALTTTSTFGTTINLGSTAAFTPPSAFTGAWFHMEVDIGLRTLGLGANTSLVMTGKLEGDALPTATFGRASIPATNTSPAVATTVDNTINYYLWPYLTLSAATAGNTMSVHSVKLYGEN
jgi:hypothetical protein